MIKIFLKKIDFTTDNTYARDVGLLESAVNSFMSNPEIVVGDSEWLEFTQPSSTNLFLGILIRYNVKRN
jgi:hypothetical protein